MVDRGKIYAVLLAGGKGTRLWPLSTRHFSKSFIRIGKRRALIEETIGRLNGLVKKKNIIIVVDKAQARLVSPFMAGVPRRNMLIEPFGRSTASAVGLAAIALKAGDIMAVLPTDAMIKESAPFRKAIKSAADFAKRTKGAILCVGVRPRTASAAYGYVKVRPRPKGNVYPVPNPRAKVNVGTRIWNGVYSVDKFMEKPGEKIAAKFVKKENYLWNAGMFIFRAGDILEAIKKHAPILHRELMLIKKKRSKIAASYSRMKNVSIDYQIMEKAKNLYCAKGNFSWLDLGSWAAVGKLYAAFGGRKDKHGNICFGKATLVNSRNCIVYNAEKNNIGVIGLHDAIVVAAKSGTLVCRKSDAEKVKELATRINENTRA